MRWFLYNILFFIAGLFLLPHFYLKMKRRGGYKANFKNRFGRYTPEQLKNIGEGGAILIHAVSVGEVGVAFQFMASMREVNPNQRFVISTTSSTGWKEAEKRLTEKDILIYNALDLPIFVNRELDRIKPSAFITVETEIWPNLIRACARRSIPMFIVNGRISDKTAPTYRKLRFWFGPVLRLFKLILVQSDLDASRFISAGANPETIQVTGSFKFDVAKRNEVKEAMWKELLEKSAFNAPQMILLGASTWDGEEALLLDTYKALSQKYPNLRLILVPRHFERREVVEKEISARGLNSVRKSDLDSGAYKVKPLTDKDVILADTTGEIMGLFPFAAVTVVGRTFRSQGGQNMIEPCLVGVPTIVGPETQNFRPVMADLLASKAIIQLSKDEELIPELDRLLGDETARKELGTTASNAVLARRGVVNHCVNAIKSVIFR